VVCEFLQGLLAPRCAARDTYPVPTMIEEIVYCLGNAKGRCPHYRQATSQGRIPRPTADFSPGLDEPLAP
jgi:hypothetical protein